ncbi:MAG: ATP-dependent DNA helicase [Candidatus Norongarragalinales archaeon]
MAEVSLLFRHENFRAGQKQIVSDVWHALKAGKHLLLNAPTGSGKTDAVLSPALTYALQNDLDVFFVTPKTSQHEIAFQAAAGIADKYGLDFGIVDFNGKKNMCLDEKTKESPDFYHACRARSKARKCVYYAKSRDESACREAVLRLQGKASREQLLAECAKQGLCAYEAAVRIARSARLVIADYYQLFAPGIKEKFLRGTGKNLSQSIIIVDEAHNLPQRLRDYLSSSVNEAVFQGACREAAATRHPVRKSAEKAALAFAEFKARRLCACSLDELKREASGGAPSQLALAEELELPVAKNEFLELLGGEEEAAALSAALAECGEKFLEREERQKSACIKLSEFIALWLSAGSDYLRALSARGLECKCLDSAPATSAANSAYSCIAMSGTLLPLEMYRDVIGLPESRTLLKEYPSSFPPENRLNLVVDEVTTRFSERSPTNYERIAAILQEVGNAMSGKRTAFFFASYKVMREIIPLLRFQKMFVQKEQASAVETSELIEAFKKDPGVLCGVMGGSLSEGIDYDGGELKCICLVGVPLQEVSLETQSLVSYYDKKFGRGWEYGYVFPAMNKALQAAGRGVRSTKDKCVVLFMDSRYLEKAYKQCFPRDLYFYRARNPAAQVEAFFSNQF